MEAGLELRAHPAVVALGEGVASSALCGAWSCLRATERLAPARLTHPRRHDPTPEAARLPEDK
jgi:hypothetical protein